MSAFYDRKYDVLLSTTIVESGLDIPSANTLIVYRSDRFGLAQLYQLRGRVGRSKTRAYAYLTMPADRVDHRSGAEAAAGARRPRQPRRRLPARQPRPRHPRRRQSARRRAIGPHQGSRVRALPIDARGRDHRDEGGRRSAARRVHAADQRRCADHDPRDLCARPRPAHGPVPPPGRARGPAGDRRVRRRDDRPLRRAARRDREPAEDRRGEAQLPRGDGRQARPRRARRGRHLRRRRLQGSCRRCSATSTG